MNPWHDVSAERVLPNDFLALIEISKGSKNKYELDKETGRLILDRVLSTSTIYPHNYGLIPRTYAQDKDPLDVLVICSEPILPMSFVRCKPIGVLIMTDNGYKDEKIIAVAYSDPFYNTIDDVHDLPKHIFDEIKHFFTVYKTLEGKVTAVDEIFGKAEALDIIVRYRKIYEEVIAPTVHQKRKERGY